VGVSEASKRMQLRDYDCDWDWWDGTKCSGRNLHCGKLRASI